MLIVTVSNQPILYDVGCEKHKLAHERDAACLAWNIMENVLMTSYFVAFICKPANLSKQASCLCASQLAFPKFNMNIASAGDGHSLAFVIMGLRLYEYLGSGSYLPIL